MLNFRAEQLRVFQDIALNEFKLDMVKHSKTFTPALSNVLGDQQLLIVVNHALKQAAVYGFTKRGPVRLYLEMMFLLGSHFDSDPQYTQLTKHFQSDADQMLRAEATAELINDYVENIGGPEGTYAKQALQTLPALATEPYNFSQTHFIPEILARCYKMYPQKARYVGEDKLIELIQQGNTLAQQYGFPTGGSRIEALLIVLMFSFGHGCTNDPQYPWIARTLDDPQIVDQAARAQRLERKALTWLKHTLQNT